MNPEKEFILKLVRKVAPEADIIEHRNQLTVTLSPENLVRASMLLKDSDETSFDMLIDITAIDWFNRPKRFETVYFLYSNKKKWRLRLKAPLEGDMPTCPSLTPIWASANWFERETFDMYGIKFENHPDLRRFYMPEDFNDPVTKEPLFPLRKDFPLMGVPESLPLPPYPERDDEE